MLLKICFESHFIGILSFNLYILIFSFLLYCPYTWEIPIFHVGNPHDCYVKKRDMGDDNATFGVYRDGMDTLAKFHPHRTPNV